MDLRTAGTLRAYLEGLTGDQSLADGLCLGFLRDHAGTATGLVQTLSALHEWLRAHPITRPRGKRASRESLRLIDWHLEGFSAGERAIVLLSGIAGVTVEDAARIVGTTPDHAHAVRADAQRRFAAFSPIIVARGGVIAEDIDTILRGIGVARCEHMDDPSGIPARLRQGRGLIVADLDGLPTEDRATLMTFGARPHQPPLVVLTGGTGDRWTDAIVVRKPFTARGLRAAVLDAIGA
ncbi:hypothetical protein J4558_14265 [Leptolyngbya sp. 15MV]|nr:hypothetical protein J4558_14265 [Leptolyngbya sp. 15MV]